jgi:hypothetical protein
MKYDRNEMLKKFLANEELIKHSQLSEEEILKVNFVEDSGDILIESLKSLLLAFCKEESQAITLRQINLRINQLSEEKDFQE